MVARFAFNEWFQARVADKKYNLDAQTAVKMLETIDVEVNVEGDYFKVIINNMGYHELNLIDLRSMMFYFKLNESNEIVGMFDGRGVRL